MSSTPVFFNQNSLHSGKLSRVGIDPSNRGFKYGDGFFETMRFQNGRILFLEQHSERMRNTCDVLGLSPRELPDLSEVNEFLRDKAKDRSYRLRITFYRLDGVGYTPNSGSLGWVGEFAPLEEENFSFGTSGLHTVVYEMDRKLAFGKLSNVKSLNAQLYVHAGRFAQQKNLREVIVLNQHNRVCEGVQSNIFLISEGKLITPALSEGPVGGVMRSVVRNLAREKGIETEETTVAVADVHKADEVFFTNTIRGIQWCVGFREQRYKTRLAKELHKSLCSLV